MRNLLFSILFLCTSAIAFAQPAADETKSSGEIHGRALSFIPDYTFKGSALTGWKQLGGASWSAQNGEIIGKSRTGEGWLISDHSFQDIGINTIIKVPVGTEAGILFRGEKTGGGMKAVLASINGDSSRAYSVVIDAQGKIISKERIRNAGGMVRVAPPANPNATAGGGGGGGGQGRRGGGNGPTLPVPRLNSAFQPNEWNQLEFILDMNILRGFINDGMGPSGAVDSVQFGSIALYVNGPGEVRFKDLKYKDLALRSLPREKTSSRFQVQQI